ncbi:MAG: IMPACT family protein [Oscillospiraceae bacterium]|nr:IMPACT family protein [Oscillospiraceae bacterium]
MELMEYQTPAGHAQCELTEKRSRFLGQLWPVESEEQARGLIEAVKKQHYSARHNCWCYRLQANALERCSDDGEPQGTAGQPMLEVFRKGGVTNLCCVVTRYFGGVLLGTGGLARAYTQSAKDALTAAGVVTVRPWAQMRLVCPYAQFERMRLEVQNAGGAVDACEYADQVTLTALLPQGAAESFAARVSDLTCGACRPEELGVVWKGLTGPERA